MQSESTHQATGTLIAGSGAEAKTTTPLQTAPHETFLARTFSSLKHRNYRLYFSGNLITQVGGWLQMTAQSWLAYQITESPFFLGLVNFVGALPVMLLSLHAGVLVDRFPRRNVLMSTQITLMASALILATLVFTAVIQPWHLLVLSFLNGIANAFDGTARQSFVKDMVGKADMANAIALNSSVMNMSRIVGPALAGVLIATVGAGWCFFLRGLTILAVLSGMFRMRDLPFAPPVRKASMWLEIREGLSYIRANRAILILIAVSAVTGIFGFPYATLLPAYAREVIQVDAQHFGLLSTATGIGALSGSLMVAATAHQKRKGLMLTIGNLMFPAALIVLALSRQFEISWLILLFTGWGFMVQSSTANTLVQSNVPDHLRGRVMSVYMLCFFGMSPLGSLQAGYIAEHWGVPAGIAVGATIALIFGLLVLWRVPQVRRMG